MTVRRQFPRAFTLIELLVAIAISTILAAVLVSLCASTLTIWGQETARSESRNAAMAVFGQVWRDLRYAELPSDEPGSKFEMVINPSTVSAAYLYPQAAFWQAPSARDRTQGENAVVGYFIKWVGTSPKLCRLLINPSSVDYKINASTAPADWVSDTILTNDAPADLSIPAKPYQGLIANNVLGLWLTPLDQQQNPITLTAANTTVTPTGTFDSRNGYICNGRTYLNALPASMTISIVVVDSRAASHLTGTEKPTSTQTPSTFLNGLPQIIQKGARIYSTVVTLVNAPPP